MLVLLSGASVAPESRATFRFTPDGALELRYGDRRARYIRLSDQHLQQVPQLRPATPWGAPPATAEPPPARPWWRFW